MIDSCDSGYVDCNGNAVDGCEAIDEGLPGTPRLLAPANGEYTGSFRAGSSRMPLLRWTAPQSEGSCAELTYEVQIEDSCADAGRQNCAFSSPEAEARGIAATSHRPEEPLFASVDLPAGTRYFWRVRACEAGDRCSDWSEVRYLNVGRLRDDLNGDGYSDVLALSLDEGSNARTHIVPGDSPMNTRPGMNIPANPSSFDDVRFLGDLNGDGFMDAAREGAEPVLLLGALSAAISTVPIPTASASTLHAVAALGDFNGDGFDDFAFSDYSRDASPTNPPPAVRIFLGSEALDLSQPLEVTPPAGTTPLQFGMELEGGLDMNGDGYTDLAIMDGDDGRVHVVYGGATPTAQVRASLLTSTPCNYVQGAQLARAGDMNGDGYAELAVRCGFNAFVFVGGRTLPLAPAWTHTLDSTAFPEGRSLVGGFDLGQDGYADLVLHGDQPQGKNLLVLPGGQSFSAQSTPVPFGGRLADSDDPRSGSGLTLGDHEGDGRPDLVVQVPISGSPPNTAVGNLRWFSGGKKESATGTCDQPNSSFEAVGNWCEASALDIEGKYQRLEDLNYPIGNSFGFVLAR